MNRFVVETEINELEIESRGAADAKHNYFSTTFFGINVNVQYGAQQPLTRTVTVVRAFASRIARIATSASTIVKTVTRITAAYHSISALKTVDLLTVVKTIRETQAMIPTTWFIKLSDCLTLDLEHVPNTVALNAWISFRRCTHWTIRVNARSAYCCLCFKCGALLWNA